MSCARCGAVRPLANLTRVGADLWCPLCLYKKAEYQWMHQTLDIKGRT